MISEYLGLETGGLDGHAPRAPSFAQRERSARRSSDRLRVFGQREINMIARRTFIKRASMVAIAATASAIGRQSRGEQVSNSGGTEPPKLRAPEGACDCHMHIYDPARFAMPPSPRAAPSNATVPDYRLLQKRIGTTRVVVVQPRNYAIDNRVTVDAVAQLGPNARGVAVLHPTITDDGLKALHAAGVRGIRFTLEGEQIVALADLLRRLPTQLVFDHLANPPLPAGIEHPSHAIVRGLIDRGRTWVKLSGAYSNSKIGAPSYPEATKTARAFVSAAPERLVWGSDWPHPTMPDNNKPNDALLFDLLTEWAPDEATRNRILVRNPEALYGFAKSA